MNASDLNANQVRVLIAAFGEVDRLIAEVEMLAAATDSPFATFANDLTPSQRADIRAHAEAVRARLLAGLAALDVHLPRATGSTRAPIETRTTFAEITLADSDAKRLAGYGQLSPAAAEGVQRVLADVAQSLRALRRSVSTDFGSAFDARIGALRISTIDIARLKTLAQIITRRGFVELHGLAESLLEELESGTFEVAVFGHVSSGKSSLLNAIFATHLLPIGVTPVTAVPTRLVLGRPTRTVIRASDREGERSYRAEDVTLFVSEEHNPSNVKRVVCATLVLDSPNLDRGVAVVDTPGLGALASAGARLAYTYLPRCDLGVLVLDPAGALGREEIDLLRTLRDSGIEARIVISKADMIPPHERLRVTDYVRASVAHETGMDVFPRWVSSVSEGGSSARTWFVETIAPLLEDARAASVVSCQRKASRLRGAVITSLRAMLVRAPNDDATKANDEIAGDSERDIAQCRERCEELASTARMQSTSIVERSVATLLDNGAVPAASVVRQFVESVSEEARTSVARELSALREKLTTSLRQLTQVASPGAIRIDMTGMPALAVPMEVDALRLTRTKGFRRGGRERRMTNEIVSCIGVPLTEALGSFGRSLRTWIMVTCERTSEQFATEAAPYRSRHIRGGDEASVRADLASLEANAGS